MAAGAFGCQPCTASQPRNCGRLAHNSASSAGRSCCHASENSLAVISASCSRRMPAATARPTVNRAGSGTGIGASTGVPSSGSSCSRSRSRLKKSPCCVRRSGAAATCWRSTASRSGHSSPSASRTAMPRPSAVVSAPGHVGGPRSSPSARAVARGMAITVGGWPPARESHCSNDLTRTRGAPSSGAVGGGNAGMSSPVASSSTTGARPSAWPSVTSISTSAPTCQRGCRLWPISANTCRHAAGSSLSRRSSMTGLASPATMRSTSSPAGH